MHRFVKNMSDPQSTGLMAAPHTAALDLKKRKQPRQAVRVPASTDANEGVEYDAAHPNIASVAVGTVARTPDLQVAETAAYAAGDAFISGLEKSQPASEKQETKGVAGDALGEMRKQCAGTLMRVTLSDDDDDDSDNDSDLDHDDKIGLGRKEGARSRAESQAADANWVASWLSRMDRSNVGRGIIEHLAHVASLMYTNDVPTECPVAQTVEWRRAYIYALAKPLATPWGMPNKSPKYVMVANINGKRSVFHSNYPILFHLFAHTPPIHGASDQGVEGMKQFVKYLSPKPHLHGLMTYSLVFQGGFNSLYWEARTVERKDDGTIMDGHMCLRIDNEIPSPAHCTSALESKAVIPVIKAAWEELEENLQAHDVDALHQGQIGDDHDTWVSERVEKCRKIISGLQEERKKQEAMHHAKVRQLERENVLLGEEVASMRARGAAKDILVDRVENAVRVDAKLERAKKETEVEKRKQRRDKKLTKGCNARAKVDYDEEEPPDPPMQPQQGMTNSEHWRQCAQKIAWLRERLEDVRGEAASVSHDLAEKNRRTGEADLRIMQERDEALRRVKDVEALLSAEKQRANTEMSKASNANRDYDQQKSRLAEANRKTIDDLERKVQDAQMQERTSRSEAEQCIEKLHALDRQLDGKDAEKHVLNESMHELQRTVFRLKCTCLAAGAKYTSRLEMLKLERQKHTDSDLALTEVRKETKSKIGGLERARSQAVARAEKIQSELNLSIGQVDELRRELEEAQAKTLALTLAAQRTNDSASAKKKKKNPPPPDLLSEGSAVAGGGQPSALMRMQMELGEMNNRVVAAEEQLRIKTSHLTSTEEARDGLQALVQKYDHDQEKVGRLVAKLECKIASLQNGARPKEDGGRPVVETAPPLGSNGNRGLGSAGLDMVIKQAREHMELLAGLARRADQAECVASHLQAMLPVMSVQPPVSVACYGITPNGQGNGSSSHNGGSTYGP